ncbi:hypothetical protein ACQP1V_36370 [Microtetraspora malaysiensis]|uniref:hypothetical protein n=1 Tax=Microtetraspora malaysiensis TaxID=161358 RepID=UPI003D8CF808
MTDNFETPSRQHPVTGARGAARTDKTLPALGGAGSTSSQADAPEPGGPVEHARPERGPADGRGKPSAGSKPRRRNKSKEIGTKAETAVVRHLRDHGFPGAERRALKGNLDEGDITGCIGVCWEVKGGDAAREASYLKIADWWREAEIERENADADVAVLVVQRRGYGLERAGDWWAYLDLATATFLATAGEGFLSEEAPNVLVRMRLADIVQALRWAGYGTPLLEVEE